MKAELLWHIVGWTNITTVSVELIGLLVTYHSNSPARWWEWVEKEDWNSYEINLGWQKSGTKRCRSLELKNDNALSWPWFRTDSRLKWSTRLCAFRQNCPDKAFPWVSDVESNGYSSHGVILNEIIGVKKTIKGMLITLNCGCASKDPQLHQPSRNLITVPPKTSQINSVERGTCSWQNQPGDGRRVQWVNSSRALFRHHPTGRLASTSYHSRSGWKNRCCQLWEGLHLIKSRPNT